MKLGVADSGELADRCAADSEFMLAARGWSGGICFDWGDSSLSLFLEDGQVVAEKPAYGVIEVSGPIEIWSQLFAAVPPRLATDLMIFIAAGFLSCEGAKMQLAQYYPAVGRAIELLRPEGLAEDPSPDETGLCPRHDAPVGRYVHLKLEGDDYRVYYEEAGQGIPLLLQHTAGGHGGQYRHLFECKEITDRFRLIAYDLPFHGKSIPPVSKAWWKEQYLLRGDFLRSVPLALSAALNLDKPVFMGCSVGGMLALDLAYHHPESFRAVISLEGALVTHEFPEDLRDLLWHPQVGNQFKARMMNGTMSPKSPEAYRQETMQVYASGWPPSFLGDLHYYLDGYDLVGKAQDIDTSQVEVHIMSGEYDLSGTAEMGRAAHEAIPGSTFTEMESVGHFPMQENPLKFLHYILPILNSIDS